MRLYRCWRINRETLSNVWLSDGCRRLNPLDEAEVEAMLGICRDHKQPRSQGAMGLKQNSNAPIHPTQENPALIWKYVSCRLHYDLLDPDIDIPELLLKDDSEAGIEQHKLCRTCQQLQRKKYAILID